MSFRPTRRHMSIVGTTASGKSALAMELARHLPDCELVSIDSMQVYRGMDIGTAKPSAAEQAEVPHHLIDLVDPADEFTLRQFQAAAHKVIADIEQRGKRAILVGGTGLYLQAVVDGLEIPGQYPEIRNGLAGEPDTAVLHRRLAELDPLAASRMEADNRRRVVRALEVTLGSGKPFSSFGPGLNAFPDVQFRIIGLWQPREVSRQRIADRVYAMLDAGWLDEVQRLHDHGPLSKTAAQALGYQEFLQVVGGSMGAEAATATVIDRTRSFARRQRMWFRRDPRIAWFGSDGDSGKVLPAVLQDCASWLAQ